MYRVLPSATILLGAGFTDWQMLGSVFGNHFCHPLIASITKHLLTTAATTQGVLARFSYYRLAAA